jgi:hypothetical protein
VKDKRYRHKIFRLVQQVDDDVRESHADNRVLSLVAVVKDADQYAANGKEQMSFLFRNARIIVQKQAIENYDRISCE